MKTTLIENGTITPTGHDAAVIQGVNTAGTVRVNNLANLEALLNAIGSAFEISLVVLGIYLLCRALSRRDDKTIKRSAHIRSYARAIALIWFGTTIPGTLNWLVASARDGGCGGMFGHGL